jgi:hypothetical protein
VVVAVVAAVVAAVVVAVHVVHVVLIAAVAQATVGVLDNRIGLLNNFLWNNDNEFI